MVSIALLTSEFPPYYGGIGSYALELASAAAARGHAVTVLAPDFGKDNSLVDAKMPFRVVRYASGPPSMKTLPRRILETRRLLRNGRFDIVQAVDWPFFIPLSLSSALLNGVRRLYTVHGTEIIYMGAYKRRAMLSAIRFWNDKHAEWIANSRYTGSLLCERFPQVSKARLRAIPLGLSSNWLTDCPPRTEARKRLDVPMDRVIIVSLGRVVPRKGHGILAAALAQLPEQLSEKIEWWVIGPMIDERHADRLRQAVAGLAVKTSFLGSLPADEVKLRMCAGDLFCLPGYQDETGRVEGFGLVFLEAGACSLPSIATISGGIPEAIEDGVAGLLVPEHDTDALARAITQLVDNRLLRNQMAKAARMRAELSGWDQVVRRTYDV